MLSRKARQARRQKAQRAECQRRKARAYAAEWLKDPRPTCPVCGLPKGDVAERVDPFHHVYYDHHDPYPTMMTSCSDCWQDRYMDT